MSEKERSPSQPAATREPGTQEPFLRRWARLKAEDVKERAVPAPVPAPERTAPGSPEVPAPEEAAEAAADASAADGPAGEEALPPLEALDENSDYSAFMSPRVSEAMRKQALRKLFRSPKFNYICELDDYIDDYTSFPALGDIITADMKHAAERLLEKQLQAEEAAETASDAAPDAVAAGTLAAEDEDPARQQERGAGTQDPQPDTRDSDEDTERDA